MKTRDKAIAGTLGGLALGGLAYLATRKPAGSSSAASSPEAEGLPVRVAAAAARLIPEPPAVLGRPSSAWDDAMGGAKGGGNWAYYGEGFGTTCGVVAAYIFFLAGLPPELINRNPPEGSGFKVGEHISRLHQGAKSLGWLKTPSGDSADIQRGDLYCTVKSGAMFNGKPASGEHVGIVLSVSEPDQNGARQVVTADGGQTDSAGLQCAKRRSRTLKGTQLTLGDGPAAVAWWIRPGG